VAPAGLEEGSFPPTGKYSYQDAREVLSIAREAATAVTGGGTGAFDRTLCVATSHRASHRQQERRTFTA